VATSPPGLNHIRAQDSVDHLRARLGQEQSEQAQAEAMALSSGEALNLASGNSLPARAPRVAQGSLGGG
jgi:hypothetical protein